MGMRICLGFYYFVPFHADEKNGTFGYARSEAVVRKEGFVSMGASKPPSSWFLLTL
jgi:hypothetical protein